MRIEIPITPSAQAALNRLDPAKAVIAIAKAMDAENNETVRQVSINRLTGKGPFPVEAHRLGARSGRLLAGFRASKAVISGDTVQSSIGDDVFYAKIHEDGAHFTRKAGKVRLRTNAAGALERQGRNGRLAVFAKSLGSRAHVRYREVAYGAHEIDFPARAPIRTGILERVAAYGEAYSRALDSALTGGAA